MTLTDAVLGLAAGLVIAVLTAPVGISGAVFLLPVQLSVLDVPSPSVTPTNLLYNVVATPGALIRYRRQHQLNSAFALMLVAGTVPGVIVGSVLRVYFLAGPRAFRLLAAAFLLPLGSWLIIRELRARRPHHPRGSTMTSRMIIATSAVVGIVGGIYGIGGGSILAPILVGSGMSVVTVAPAALASTFVTSLVGAITYALLALTTTGAVAPNWTLGLICGLGALIGGYLGARLQPRLPERGLRIFLGALAVALALAYLSQSAAP